VNSSSIVRNRSFLLFLFLLNAVLWSGCSTQPGTDIESRKKIAQELKANNLFAQAKAEYESLIDAQGLTGEQRGAIAFLVADICYSDLRQYSEAAAWYIRAREYDSKASYNDDLNKNLVAALEKSGRLINAQQQLASSTSPDSTIRSADEKVVATFGQTKVYLSDVERTIQELPIELQQQLKTPDRRIAYLRQYVGVEILYEAAKREQLDKGDRFAKRRELAVKRLLVDEYVASKLTPPNRLDSADVMNFYQANKSQFADRPFPEIQQEVMSAYQSQKMESAYNELIESLAQAQKLDILEENMR
jgi:hypothetical protein